MDVSNASLYDGASAAAEAVLMAVHATGRRRIVTAGQRASGISAGAGDVHGRFGFGAGHGRHARGRARRRASWQAAVDDETACVLLQHPNFFGCLEEVERIGEIAHAAGALFVVAVDPISLGLLKRPGDYGADIVVAEGQSLGSPMAFGGPYLGILACREQFVRRMPGRIAGETVDRRGRRCWVLTLQTREQHIRREKATSNICTNQGLFALRATVYLAALGPAGLARGGRAVPAKIALRRRATGRARRLAAARSIGRSSRSSSSATPGGNLDRRIASGSRRRLLHRRAAGPLVSRTCRLAAGDRDRKTNAGRDRWPGRAGRPPDVTAARIEQPADDLTLDAVRHRNTDSRAKRTDA